jgi:FMN phosphatase YigB (HAD superfamily)
MVFLLDVDNTLIDNDRIEQDLRDHLEEVFGLDACRRYWIILEELRREVGYADFLGALQRYRLERLHDPRLLGMSSFLVDYPFAERLYPGALEVITHLHAFGPVAILSDGDAVFQPRKVVRSGLWRAVDGRVLIYIHKEEMLDDVQTKYPAEHYVFVDDKPRPIGGCEASVGKQSYDRFRASGALRARPCRIENLSTLRREHPAHQ